MSTPLSGRETMSLFLLLDQGDTDGFNEQLSKANQSELSSLNHRGQTLLHVASSLGLTNAVSSLLAIRPKPFDIDAIDKAGDTALSMTARTAHADVVKLLLDAGADVRHCSELLPVYEDAEEDREIILLSPYQLAKQKGHEAVVAVIFDHMVENFEDAAIFNRFDTWDSSIFVFELDFVIDVNQTNHKGQSILHCVALIGSKIAVEAVLERDSLRVRYEDNYGQNILSAAVVGRSPGVLDLLIERVGDVIDIKMIEAAMQTATLKGELELRNTLAKLLKQRQSALAPDTSEERLTTSSAAIEAEEPATDQPSTRGNSPSISKSRDLFFAKGREPHTLQPGTSNAAFYLKYFAISALTAVPLLTAFFMMGQSENPTDNQGMCPLSDNPFTNSSFSPF